VVIPRVRRPSRRRRLVINTSELDDPGIRCSTCALDALLSRTTSTRRRLSSARHTSAHSASVVGVPTGVALSIDSNRDIA